MKISCGKMSKPNEVSVSAKLCRVLSDVLLQSLNGIPADFNLSTFSVIHITILHHCMDDSVYLIFNTKIIQLLSAKCQREFTIPMERSIRSRLAPLVLLTAMGKKGIADVWICGCCKK